MNQRNFIIYDTETTGLDPHDGAEILQISACAVNCNSLELHYAGRFNMFIKPENLQKASQKALEVAKQSFETAQVDGVPLKIALKKFLDWCSEVNPSGKAISKPIRVGHNEGFDYKFLDFYIRQLKMVKKMDDLPWSNQTLDTLDMAFLLFENDNTTERYNLDVLCEKFGIKRESKSHDAAEDVELCRVLFVRMMNGFRQMTKKIKINEHGQKN